MGSALRKSLSKGQPVISKNDVKTNIDIAAIARGTIHLNPEGVEFSLPLDPDAINMNVKIDWINECVERKVPCPYTRCGLGGCVGVWTMIERMHGGIVEHRHDGYDYFHPVSRIHAESAKEELPIGYVLGKKPLAEKLILDLVEVTPIQKMEIGKSLEIGAVQSLMEGLMHHRCVASTLISDSFKDADAHYGTLFYAEWKPNHSDRTHRYLIEVSGENVYVGYFPYDGRKPKLYGIHHKKQEVVKFLHKTHAELQLPELTLLTELNIPNIEFESSERTRNGGFTETRTYISHKQGEFYTRSVYGTFVPLQECVFTPAPTTTAPQGENPNKDDIDLVEAFEVLVETIPVTRSGTWNDTEVDSTGFNMGNPKHPWYAFQGATGYIQLVEGKMFCYPDGSLRFLTSVDEQTMFRDYTDLQIVQGDLVAYEGSNQTPFMEFENTEFSLDRHEVKSEIPFVHDRERVFVREDCVLTITHPEHGETKYEAMKGEMLALLPGTSRPFQKAEGRD